MRGSETGEFDVIVVGSGIAGLYASLVAATRGRVALLTKGNLDDGCSRWAQGGIAAALGDDDTTQQHYDDTMAAGRGLCHADAVRVLVEEGPARVRELMSWGVAFDMTDGRTQLAREAAHSRARVAHARGDGTGLEIETALIRRVRERGITLIEHAHVDQLLLDRRGRCSGVRWTDQELHTHDVTANAVILASGGAAALWPRTTNPETSTGDGVALAYEAGADVAGMEFMQFHPTALAIPGARRFLISEAVRGAGAVVVDDGGRRFLLDADPLGELAGRDVVARAIWERMRDDGSDHVWLDCSRVPDVAACFPAIAHACAAHGMDLARDRIPIAPAAHYTIGGVRTDIRGATSVPGLYACGEVASTGVHGANRLASNSLLESVVFGNRAATAACADMAEAPPAALPVAPPSPLAPGDDMPASWERMQTALWNGAGILRDDGGLRAALDACTEVQAAVRADTRAGLRLRSAATTATLVVSAALQRTETRGCHIRTDHPHSSDQWHGDLVMQRERGAHRDDRT